MTRSFVLKGTAGAWAGVDAKRYKDGTGPFAGVSRHTLLGAGDSEPELAFEVRYFEVAPGGYTSLERHTHAHAVLVVKGRGRVRLGDRVEAVRPLDIVFVAGSDVHRFEADGPDPMGFICIVDRERDRPVPVTEGPAEPS